MPLRPPALLLGIATGTLLVLNTVFMFSLMVPAALVKLLVPVTAVRRVCDRVLNALASRWVAVNNAWIAAVCRRPWDVRGVDGLNPRGWYMVSCNHQSWVDILVLQRVFHGRVPFLKFFLKRELIWVPVIGLAWWALDFPFMKRGRGGRGADLEATRAACRKFQRVPTSVINFIEGTRATPAKRAQSGSPYRHLLKPKLGGLGVALATMGEQFESLLDVTLVYPEGTPRFWDLLSGRLGPVVVRVTQRPIPAELLGADPSADRGGYRRISRWVDSWWADKDRLIDELMARPAG